MKLLTGSEIWARIGALIQTADQAFVAVPYLGEGAAEMLPLKRGSVLVTRYEVGALKAGQICPKDVIKLVDQEVQVFSEPRLHAKIYAFPDCVIIGSSNASKTSRDTLLEACVEIEDRAIIKKAKNYILQCANSPITPEFARALAKHYIKASHFPMAPQFSKAKDRKNTKSKDDMSERALWLLSTAPLEEASSAWNSASDTALAEAKKHIDKDARIKLETLAWTKEAGEKLSIGDNLIMRQADEKGIDWVWPPAIVHSIIKTPGKNTYAIAYSQMKNSKPRRLDIIQNKLGDSAKSLATLKYAMRRASPQTRLALLGLWSPRKK